MLQRVIFLIKEHSDKVPFLYKIGVIAANLLSLPSQVVGIVAGGLAGLKNSITAYKLDREEFFNHAQGIAKIATAVANCILFPLSLPVEIFGSYYRNNGGYHSNNYFFLDRLLLNSRPVSPLQQEIRQSIKELNTNEILKTYLSEFLYIIDNMPVQKMIEEGELSYMLFMMGAEKSILRFLFKKLGIMNQLIPSDKLKQAVLLELQEFTQFIDQIEKLYQNLQTMKSTVSLDRHFQCIFCEHLLLDLVNPYTPFPEYFQKKVDEFKNSYLQNPILNPDLKFILEIEAILLSDEIELEKTKKLVAYIAKQDWQSSLLDSHIINETLEYLSKDGMALGKASLFVQSLPEAIQCAITHNVEASALSSLNLWVGLARKLPRLSDRKSPHIDQY